jgi:hypothetical protein
MKEVPRKDLPEVSGGDFPLDGCIPYPILPGTDGDDRSRDLINPVESSVAPDA